MVFGPEDKLLLTDSTRWEVISSDVERKNPLAYNGDNASWFAANMDGHSHYEAVFCLEGKVPACLGEQFFMCPPGALVLFKPGEKHAKGYPPGTDAVHIWLIFLQKRVVVRHVAVSDGRMNMDKEELFVDNPGLYNIIIQEWSRLGESRLDMAMKASRVKALFMLLFMDLIEIDQNYSEGALSPEGRQWQIRRMISLIEKHIRDTSGRGLTIEKLARIAGYSKFHFIRLFQKETGYRVHDYINLSRVNRLKEMENSGRSQKEIAYELGFSCPSAFSHWRSKLLGRNQGGA